MFDENHQIGGVTLVAIAAKMLGDNLCKDFYHRSLCFVTFLFNHQLFSIISRSPLDYSPLSIFFK